MDMRPHLRALAPIAGTALLASLSFMLAGCDKASVTIDGDHGKRLADLDLSGPPPHGVALMGIDAVDISDGPKLTIRVEGDPAEADHLRFTLKDGTLGILRDRGFWSGGKAVTVHVTMPAPRELTAGGTGSITAATVDADHATVTIAGTGEVATPQVQTSKLEVTIAGTGTYRAAGKAGALELNIVGTGDAAMDALKVDTADVSLAGTGDGTFSSDGAVSASIVGTGTVRVLGAATCKVSAVGSGKVVCERGATAEK